MTDDPSDGWFPESVAARYDDGRGPEFDPVEIARSVDLLVELAEGGRILEFAIGTGRIAVPIARRGCDVHGIETSRSMAARLADEPGAEQIEVTIGDMRTTRVAGVFSLVYLVYNTIGNVLTQDAQVEVFANAAEHLGTGGRFIVEVGVPDLRRLPPGQDVVPFALVLDEGEGEGAESIYLGFDQYDVVTQRATSHHVTVEAGDGRLRPFPWRYVWPSELDLMARIAGLELENRWEDWSRSAFTAESTKHISIWRRP